MSEGTEKRWRVALRRLLAPAQDYPAVVDLVLTVVVVGHAVAARSWPCLDWLQPLTKLGQGDAITLHLGVTSLAAILAGFSGVIVVFALGATGPRFAELRSAGGAALQRNWVWLALSALAAAFIGLGGAVAAALDIDCARWALELAILLSLHAAARQLWLLAALAGIVSLQDKFDAKEAARRDTRALLAGRQPRRQDTPPTTSQR